MSAEVEVRDNPEKRQFDAYVDGNLAGFSAYELTDGGIMIMHTEVDDAYEGQGVGSAMVRQMLDLIRADGELKVTVLCPSSGRITVLTGPAFTGDPAGCNVEVE